MNMIEELLGALRSDHKDFAIFDELFALDEQPKRRPGELMQDALWKNHIKDGDCLTCQLIAQVQSSLAEPVTRSLRNGDIFDIGQTVNGQSRFVMFDVSKLEVRYLYDLDRRYEYDSKELIAPDRWTGEQTYRVVGFITLDTTETEASGGTER